MTPKLDDADGPPLFATPRARAPLAAEDLLAGLNEPQRSAVTHGEGPLLILAGAGSGKTRVITRRLAWLVRERGVDPRELLAITFTNKAAGEMRQRVELLLGADHQARLSTFHSMCARILRREIEHLGAGWTRDFTIYDTEDRGKLLKKLVEAAGYDTTRFKPALVGAWISRRKNAFRQGGEEGGIEGDVFKAVEKLYAQAMEKNNALDFDDLLLMVLELFEAQPAVRDAWARRSPWVMVDEYQDTNRVQYLLLRHLAGAGHNVAVCGDPDQSIYGWRGADVRNILEFEHDFGGCRVVRLEQNYRSTQNILAAAQSVIQRNSARKEKALWSEREAGEKLLALECGDEDDEAREIAVRVRSLAAAGSTLDRMAIFYRSNFQQRALERALRLASVPYQIVAGTEFFQRREIKDLIAYLRIAANPKDDEACARALAAPARGIGDKTLTELERWAADRRVPLSAAVASGEARTLARGRAKKALEEFAALRAELAGLCAGPAEQALRRAVLAVGYFEWLSQSAERDDVDRAANVDELLANAAHYDATEPEGGVKGFLQDVALISDVDGLDESAAKISLMTLHAAKGLEFDSVFIAGVEEDLLPHARALSESGDERDGVEEERRLFYVGLTRARDRLVLTFARVRRGWGSAPWRSPSRFLGEIQGDLLEGLGAADDQGGGRLSEIEPDYASDEELVLRPGQWVDHEHFGRGQLLTLAGRGPNARATVRFAIHGEKMLILQYAKLRAVEDQP